MKKLIKKKNIVISVLVLTAILVLALVIILRDDGDNEQVAETDDRVETAEETTGALPDTELNIIEESSDEQLEIENEDKTTTYSELLIKNVDGSKPLTIKTLDNSIEIETIEIMDTQGSSSNRIEISGFNTKIQLTLPIAPYPFVEKSIVDSGDIVVTKVDTNFDFDIFRVVNPNENIKVRYTNTFEDYNDTNYQLGYSIDGVLFNCSEYEASNQYCDQLIQHIEVEFGERT